MKVFFLLVYVLLSFGLTIVAAPCNTEVYDNYDGSGILPSEWTEYNTTGSVSLVDGSLRFSHSISKPSAYRSFTPLTNDVSFSFDVSTTRNSVNCQINLMSSTGQYLSTFVIGTGAATIKYATTLSSGVPSGFAEGSPVVALLKNTVYTLSARVNFTAQTVDYYADGAMMKADVPFLESASNVARLDIQSIYMYNNNGYFYFDNITLSTAHENRLLLTNELMASEALFASAVVGSNGGEYSQEAYDTFSTSIATAAQMKQNCSASASEVDQALGALETAIITFEASSKAFVKSISIDALDTEQKIVMMGGDMERNAASLQSAPNKDEIIKWLIKDIPFNTYRVKYDKLQEMTEGSVDMQGTYGDQVLSMKMILQANPNIKFFATMKSDYHGYSQGNRNNLPTFIYDYAYDKTTETYSGSKSFDAVKYGRFLADYIQYMSANNVPISYLSTSKEWTQVMTTARAKTTIETLINTLTARNVDMPLIIDPGAWSITQGYNTVTSYVSNNVNKYVYGYSTHNYSSGSKTWSDFTTATSNAGKLAVDDESGHGSGGPTNGAYEMPITKAISTYSGKCDMYDGGIQGELFFELWMGNFKYARPIMFSSTENGRRIRSYYIMKKFVKNVYDATYVNQTLNHFENVSSMAFIKDEQLVLWVINRGQIPHYNCPVSISNLDLKEGMTVQQTYWDSTSVITGVDHNIIANGDDQFNFSIPPRSINCFIVAPSSAMDLSKETIESPERLLSVFPNPTTGLLKVKSTEFVSLVRVFDIHGRQVDEVYFDGNQIDLSMLDNGMYFLGIETAKGNYYSTVIKN